MFVFPSTVVRFEVGTIVVEEPRNHFQPKSIGKRFENFPVNMGIVKTFHPSIEEFPNTNGFKVYTIAFKFMNSPADYWHFENEEQRDEEYNRLIELTCKETEHVNV